MDNNTLFNIGYGLYLLTAKENEKDNGCIINTLMQVTQNPCQIVISVNKSNYSAQMIQRTKKFNISILDKDTDFETIKNFGYQSGKDVDKFANFHDIKRSENGLLYLTKCTNSYLSAQVLKEIDLDSYIMFLAKLTDAKSLQNKESLTYNYYQKNIKPSANMNQTKGYRCKICNYVYEGETLPKDYICPICKHGIADFEKI